MLKHKCYYSWNMYIVVTTYKKRVGLHVSPVNGTDLAISPQRTSCCAAARLLKNKETQLFHSTDSYINLDKISLSHCSITPYQLIIKRNIYNIYKATKG